MKSAIFEIRCVLCKQKLGEVGIPPPLLLENREFTNADLSIADSRCAKCEKKQGTFREEQEKVEAMRLATQPKI